jgi:WD40 repeat protein
MIQFFDAFISYGRADSLDFATKLYQKLTEKKLRIWFDKENIPFGVDYQREIDEHGIEKAHNFIFIIAPHSANSPYCLKEIELAAKLEKRIIPLFHVEEITQETWQKRNPGGTTQEWEAFKAEKKHKSKPNLHPAIRKINWLCFQEGIDDFEKSFADLIEVIQKHEDYIKQHTHFLAKALEWERHQKQNSCLLIGEEVQQAESWLKRRFKNEQEPYIPTDLHCEFITESIKNDHNWIAQVFLSYSDAYKEKMEEICNRLRKECITVWTKKTDISTGEELKEAVNQGIEQADNVVYLLSPDSVNSKDCQCELGYALSFNKRIIPVLVEATDSQQVPSALRSLQYIDLTDNNANFDELIRTLNTDLKHVRSHTKWLQRALEWQKAEKSKSGDLLLRGSELATAEDWLQEAARKDKKPEPSHHHKVFIEASQNAKKRRQIFSVVAVSIVFSSVVTAFFLYREAAISEIQTISVSSEELLTSNKALEALVAAIKAGQRLKKLPWTQEGTQTLVVQALQRSLYRIKEHNRLSGHKDSVDAVSISPDGQIIATASQDKAVKLWKRDGTLRKTLEHSAQVYAVAFSADSQIIVSGDEKGTVKLWKRDGTLLNTLVGHSRPVKGVAFSPDGQMFATASWDKTVKLWKQDGTLLKTLTPKGASATEQTTVAFSPDNRMIASGGWNGTVNFWKNDGTFLKDLSADKDGGEVYSVAFSPDGQIITTASDDKTVKLWKRDGTPLNTLEGHKNSVRGVAFSPDGQTIASVSSDRTVKLWKPDGTLLTTLDGHSAEVHGVAFSPDGQTIASASQDETVKLWKQNGTSKKTLSGYNSSVYAVSISTDGQMIATADGDKEVKLWKPDGTLLYTLGKHNEKHTDRVFAVAFSPDNPMIASGGGEGIVKLWKPDGTFLKDLKIVNKYDAIRAVSISPDGQIIASGGDDATVKLWKQDGTLLNTLKGHTNKVWTISFSPDSQMIASGSWDGKVKLWKRDGTPLKTLNVGDDRVYGVAFSPDGQTIVSASEDGKVKLWKRGGTLLKTLNVVDGRVYGVAFSPNGQTIASASEDGKVKLWKQDGTFFKDLNVHKDGVLSISFSRDGNMLASASQDKTVILWNMGLDLNLDELLKYSCDWVRDYLKTNPKVTESDRHLCTGSS